MARYQNKEDKLIKTPHHHKNESSEIAEQVSAPDCHYAALHGKW
jgi:hypothetical protein